MVLLKVSAVGWFEQIVVGPENVAVGLELTKRSEYNEKGLVHPPIVL
jgi:hypothetical protein